MRKATSGFTIVELLIVIVVIAILAAISIVAYTGIQERARVSSVTSGLAQANKKMALWRVDNPNQAPASLADLGISDTSTLTYQFTYDTNASSYCITATHSSGSSYFVSSTNSATQQGTCTGYNVVAWNKITGPPPVSASGISIDTSTFRTSTASLAIAPNTGAQTLRGNPFNGTTGQVYTVSLWLKTDANWNGTSGNSKIRYANAANNAIIYACAYNGVKTTWTQVTCSYPLPSGYTGFNISVANDGTVGTIWIDDVSLTIQ